MKFFVDTAELDEIKALLSSNLIDGVTTNPSLIAKSGKNIKDTISNICIRWIPNHTHRLTIRE